MEDFKLNDRVIVIGKNSKGKIAFIGETHFAEGQMFGVILDKPKGKYTGTIGSVCYFNCSPNYGTFVRACQLKKDAKTLSQECILSSYPNYLKDSSSKHGLKTIQKRPSKSEFRDSSTYKKKPESSKNLQCETFEKGDCETKTSPGKNDATKDTPNFDKTLKELTLVKQKLSERNKKIDTVHSYLRKLKTYMKWSKDIKRSSNGSDRRIENFLKLLVDNVLKKMEDAVGQISSKTLANNEKNNSAVSDENNFLRMYVDILEKRNEVLADSLMHVKNILEHAWNSSSYKKKCICISKPDGPVVDVECKDCSPKLLRFTDVLEQETRLFLETNPINNMGTLEQSNRELEEFTGSEKIKRYLESLSPSPCDVPLRKKNRRINTNLGTQSVRSSSTSSPRLLSQSLTEPDVSLKYKSFSQKTEMPSKTKQRSVSLSHRRLNKQITDKFPAKNVKNSTVELQDFIPGIMPTVTDKNKSENCCSTELVPLNKSTKEGTSTENISNSVSDVKPKRASTKPEKSIKRPRRESVGTSK